jgi:hypothetical protein
MVKVPYDVTDASPWDWTPLERPPADLPPRRKLELWSRQLWDDQDAIAHLKDRYALTEETIRNRALGLRNRSDGQWYVIPIFHGAGTELTLRTLKERQRPPERPDQPKYRATAGRGIHLYPWPISGREVVVCSGEFDQMNLEQAGLNAVTSTGGADPRGWPSEWLVELAAGRACRIVFDRGEEAFAEGLAARLKEAHASSVRVIHLPADLPTKTDISDLAREWGHDGLRRFVSGRHGRRLGDRKRQA